MMLFRPFRKRRKKSKKAIIRERNRRIFRMLMARQHHLTKKRDVLSLSSILENGRVRSKKSWKQKVRPKTRRISPAERSLHVERRVYKMRERIRTKRTHAEKVLSI